MKMRIELKTGTVVVNADDVVVAEETYTPDADYAGIIADKYSETPYLLFFSCSKVNEFNCEEEDAIVDKLIANRPQFESIRRTEIPIKEIDGKTVTLENWAKQMRLGIFMVPDVADENHLYNGFGMVRK